MNYKLYTTSVKAWDGMIEEIKKAEKSIYLEMYIFLDDTSKSHDFLGYLKKKAQAGVRVVIVADAYGSKGLKNENAKILEQSGIELIFFSHWLRHVHRKILIVDKKVAFIGGVNIGKKFKHWNDLQLKVQGKIVRRMLRSFAYTYEMSGGRDSKILKLREGKISSKLKFWLMEHWPSRNIYAMKKHYVEKITGAQKSIQIVTPYFTPPRWLTSLLDDAMRRGVSVEIMIPQNVDIPIMNRVNFRYIYNLYSMGAKFYMNKKMNHSKLLLIDGQEGLLGSQNMDLASFRYNSEVGIFFTDKKLVKEISQIIKSWKNHSVDFRPMQYKLNIIDYIILALMKILKPIL